MKGRMLKNNGFYILGFVFSVFLLAWLSLAPAHFKKTWAGNPVIAYLIREHQAVDEKSKVVAISYYLPHFPYFADIVTGLQQPTVAKMESYFEGKPYIFHTYYQKAVDYFPTSDAAQFLLGYCEYQMGLPESAVKHFEASLKENPYFFWTYYNLGIMYYRQGEYYKSALMFTQALAMNPQVTLQIINRTSLYQQIWRRVYQVQDVLARNISEASQDAALLLAACYLKAKAHAQALAILKQDLIQPSFRPELRAKLLAAANQQLGLDPIEPLLKEIPVRIF